MADVEFFFDPVCPWSWITSRWVHEVDKQREMHVHWRFISLHVLNEGRDYSLFPPNYLESHTAGLKLLRVAASIREEQGAAAMAALYTPFGPAIQVNRRGR